MCPPTNLPLINLSFSKTNVVLRWQWMYRTAASAVAQPLLCCAVPLQLVGVCEVGGLLMLVSEFVERGFLEALLHLPELRWHAR